MYFIASYNPNRIEDTLVRESFETIEEAIERRDELIRQDFFYGDGPGKWFKFTDENGY